MPTLPAAQLFVCCNDFYCAHPGLKFQGQCKMITCNTVEKSKLCDIVISDFTGLGLVRLMFISSYRINFVSDQVIYNGVDTYYTTQKIKGPPQSWCSSIDSATFLIFPSVTNYISFKSLLFEDSDKLLFACKGSHYWLLEQPKEKCMF